MANDGESVRWLSMVDDDLAVCGAESTEKTLLAAVCPVAFVGQLVIQTLPPPAFTVPRA